MHKNPKMTLKHYLLNFRDWVSLCLYLAVLELTLYTRLASNSENLLPLSPSTGIKGMGHYCLTTLKLLNPKNKP